MLVVLSFVRPRVDGTRHLRSITEFITLAGTEEEQQGDVTSLCARCMAEYYERIHATSPALCPDVPPEELIQAEARRLGVVHGGCSFVYAHFACMMIRDEMAEHVTTGAEDPHGDGAERGETNVRSPEELVNQFPRRGVTKDTRGYSWLLDLQDLFSEYLRRCFRRSRAEESAADLVRVVAALGLDFRNRFCKMRWNFEGERSTKRSSTRFERCSREAVARRAGAVGEEARISPSRASLCMRRFCGGFVERSTRSTPPKTAGRTLESSLHPARV